MPDKNLSFAQINIDYCALIIECLTETDKTIPRPRFVSHELALAGVVTGKLSQPKITSLYNIFYMPGHPPASVRVPRTESLEDIHNIFQKLKILVVRASSPAKGRCALESSHSPR